MESRSSRATDAVPRQRIERLLNHSRFRLRFPAPLEATYRAYHDADALRVFRGSLGYLVLLYLAMAGAALVVAPRGQLGAWPLVFSGFGLLILIGCLLVRSQLLERFYQRVVCALAALAVALSIINPMLVTDPGFRVLVYIGGAYAVVVVYLGLSLRLPYAMLAGWGVGLPLMAAGYALAPRLGLAIDWLLVLATFVGASVLCMVICYRDERQSRRVFLQAELLRMDREHIALLAEELQKQALVDGLTGLANRRQFDQALQREWGRAHREHLPLALVFADIDHFKAYNDYFGHQEGDDCMRVLAGIFRAQARRATDLAGRYGGEEFVLLLPGVMLAEAASRAELLAAAVRAASLPHPRSSCANTVTLSIGVAAMVPTQDGSPDELVRRADQALYEAKAAGRNRVIAR